MIPLDGENLPRLMLAVGVALLTFTMMRLYLRRSRQGRSRDMTVRRPLASPRSGPGDAPVEVLRWQVEMHELARELKAELDTKMRALEVLVAMAEEERRELERLLAELRSERPPSDQNPSAHTAP